MPDSRRPTSLPDLHGARILVVEDSWLLADMIADQLGECGCSVAGPARCLDAALSLAASERLDGALLDVDLAGEESFPVARLLQARGVRFAFLTGYSDIALPDEFAGVPCLTKPFTYDSLTRLIAGRFGPNARIDGS